MLLSLINLLSAEGLSPWKLLKKSTFDWPKKSNQQVEESMEYSYVRTHLMMNAPAGTRTMEST